jgi:hypothetical protein
MTIVEMSDRRAIAERCKLWSNCNGIAGDCDGSVNCNGNAAGDGIDDDATDDTTDNDVDGIV